MPRWVRMRLSRAPTCSSAAAMAAGEASSTRPSDSRFPETARFVGNPPAGRHLGDMTQYDVAIMGGGAAGLSAALVLARARRNVLVIDAGTPRNAPAAHMHGYLSRDGMPPAELLAAGRREVEHYGGQVVSGRVTRIRRGPRALEVLVGTGSAVDARCVRVPTGLRDGLPD